VRETSLGILKGRETGTRAEAFPLVGSDSHDEAFVDGDRTVGGDRTFKLASGRASGPGRYVKALGDPVAGLGWRSSRF